MHRSVARSTGRSYRLYVYPDAKHPGADFVKDYTYKTLTVYDIENLPQLMNEIQQRLGLRRTSGRLLVRDIASERWREIWSLEKLRDLPNHDEVAFVQAFARAAETGQVPVPSRVSTAGSGSGSSSSSKLTLEQKRETLRRYYTSVRATKTEAEIDSILVTYDSETRWEALLIKMERKYRKPVALWRDSGDSAVPDTRSPRIPLGTHTVPALNESWPAHEFICAEQNRLLDALN